MKKVRVYSTKKRKPKKQVRTMLKQYRNKDGTKVETKPERLIKKVLRELGISFQQEYGIKYEKYYRVYDFYCYVQDRYSLLIECDGCFFHAKEYYTEDKPLSKLHKIQRKNIRNDKLKTKIAKELGIPLLRLWEDEINNDIVSCKQKIISEINKQESIIQINVLS